MKRKTILLVFVLASSTFGGVQPAGASGSPGSGLNCQRPTFDAYTTPAALNRRSLQLRGSENCFGVANNVDKQTLAFLTVASPSMIPTVTVGIGGYAHCTDCGDQGFEAFNLPFTSIPAARVTLTVTFTTTREEVPTVAQVVV